MHGPPFPRNLPYHRRDLTDWTSRAWGGSGSGDSHRDHGDGSPHLRVYLKHLCSTYLVERPDPASSQTKAVRRQQYVLDCCRRILDAIQISAPLSVPFGRAVRFRAYHNDPGRFLEEPLIVSGAGESALDLLCAYQIEKPGLPVTCRRCSTRCLQQTSDGGFWYVVRCELPDASPVVYCIYYILGHTNPSLKVHQAACDMSNCSHVMVFLILTVIYRQRGKKIGMNMA